MSPGNLTGRWIGHYVQRGQEHPITAEFLHVDDRLTGSMRDGHPDQERSVFEAAAEAGLPPGADEQIEARLREIIPDAQSGPIRSVTHLPSDATLEGQWTGATVSFRKNYQGASFHGYRVGDKMIGVETPGHTVHYEGRLSADGSTIEGHWWIDANPREGVRRTEGGFRLSRAEGTP